MIDIKEILFLWFTSFFHKKSSDSGVNNENKQNEQLAKELHKSSIKKLLKKKIVFIIQRQYLDCWSCRYAINKQI